MKLDNSQDDAMINNYKTPADIYGANWPNDSNGDAITDAVPSRLIGYKTLRSSYFPEDANGNIKDLEFKGTPKV